MVSASLSVGSKSIYFDEFWVLIYRLARDAVWPVAVGTVDVMVEMMSYRLCYLLTGVDPMRVARLHEYMTT
jgi:hypothetical protein